MKENFDEELLLHKHKLDNIFDEKISDTVRELKKKHGEKDMELEMDVNGVISEEMKKAKEQEHKLGVAFGADENRLMMDFKKRKEKLMARIKDREDRLKKISDDQENKINDEKDRLEKMMNERNKEIKAREEKAIDNLQNKKSWMARIFSRKQKEIEKVKEESIKEKQRQTAIRKKLLKEEKGVEAEVEKKFGEMDKEKMDKLRVKYDLLVASLQKKSKELSRHERNLIDKNGELNEMEGELAKQKKAGDMKLKKELEKIGLQRQINLDKIAQMKREIKQKLEQEKEEEIHRVLKNQSEQLKKQLRKEFDNRLELEIRKKEAEIEQKKLLLEQEIQMRAKSLFR